MDEKERAILAAIKKDDLAAFKKLIDKETEKISFGRFPLLSLCYLYDSRKIAFTYEKQLLSIPKYTQREEDRESYNLFRKKARRVLRLYVGGRTVSPLVMLAVTGRHDALRALYPAAYKDAAIRSELEYAEKILYSSPVTFGQNSIRIRKQKLPVRHLAAVMGAAALSVVMIVCCLIGFFYVPRDGGTEDNPAFLFNEKQLMMALGREDYFALKNDVEVKDVSSIENFRGTLDGKGKKLSFAAKDESFIGELSGTIKNLTVEIAVSGDVEESKALFIEKNSGALENVTLIVTGSVLVKDKKKETEDEDVSLMLSFLCGTNEGTIKDCVTKGDFSASNEGTRDSYISTLASQNNGTVTHCSSEGKISTDTVDVAGLVISNGVDATIEECECRSTLIQKTAKNIWTPNVSGICLRNSGTIVSCVFSGEMTGESAIRTKVTTEEGEIITENVYLGGISCENGGVIKSCKAIGRFNASSAYAHVYIGGIVTFNYGEASDNSFEGEIAAGKDFENAVLGGNVARNAYVVIQKSRLYMGVLTNGKSEGKITAVAGENAIVHAGGAAGENDGAYVRGGTYGTEIEISGGKAYVGGVVGSNSVKQKEYQSTLLYYSAGIIGATAKGSIRVGNDSYIGGVAGENEMFLQQCEAEIEIAAGNACFIGGLAGINTYSVKNSIAVMTLSAGDDCTAGGVVGDNSYRVENNEAQADITVGDRALVGGFVAMNSGAVTVGKVSGVLEAGKNSVLGGVVGQNEVGYVRSMFTSVTKKAGEDSSVGGIVAVADKTTVSAVVQKMQDYADEPARLQSWLYATSPYCNNGFVGTTEEKAVAVVSEYEGEGANEAIQAKVFADEAEMKKSNEYKGVFGDETDQDDAGVSGGNGSDNTL